MKYLIFFQSVHISTELAAPSKKYLYFSNVLGTVHTGGESLQDGLVK